MARKAEVEVSVPSSWQALKDQLALGAETGTETDNSQAMFQIVDRIMRAETVDEVLGIATEGPAKVEDYVGVPITFVDFRVVKSADQYDAESGPTGLKHYAVIAAINLLTGEDVVITCGSTHVLAQLQRIQNMATGFPFTATFQDNTSAKGYHIYKIRSLTAVERSAVKNASA